MKTYPEEAKKAVAEAEKQAAVVLHRLVRPFLRENTAMWRARDEIRDAIEDLRNAADEAMICIENQERLQQASAAFYAAEKAIARLWPNAQAEASGDENPARLKRKVNMEKQNATTKPEPQAGLPPAPGSAYPHLKAMNNRDLVTMLNQCAPNPEDQDFCHAIAQELKTRKFPAGVPNDKLSDRRENSQR